MCLRAADEPDSIREAWTRLEERVELKGRKFFGVFDPARNEYSACVELLDGDDPPALGLEETSLPGGTYLRARLRGEPPDVYNQIPSTFQELVEAAAVDESRPSIEFYRRRDEIDLLLPVLPS